MNGKGDYAGFLPVTAHRVCLPRGRLSVGHNGSVKSVEIVDDHRTGYVIENVLSGTVHAEYAGWWKRQGSVTQQIRLVITDLTQGSMNHNKVP